ncbi:MAG: hypothetical protein VB049_00385 [Candidatus Pelethousia sp.]|nr:hypothetical protein [Candidatus Pelethousia sp.]
MKKYAILACVALLLLMGGIKAYLTPVSYLSVDINPSVELGINAFGQVVSAEGYNTDGRAILNGIKVTGMRVKKAVNTVIAAAASNGFIDDDGSTTILLTAETDNDNMAAELNGEAETGAQEALAENGKSAAIHKENVALARRDEAKTLGITPGKLNLIEKLQAVDPTATVEQYKEAKVKDIMKAIQTLKDKGTAVGNQDENAAEGNKNEKAAAGNQSENATEGNQNEDSSTGNQNGGIAGEGNQGGAAGGQAQGGGAGNKR